MVRSINFKAPKALIVKSLFITFLFCWQVHVFADKPVKKITLDPVGMNLEVGAQGQFVAIVEPADASDKRITWSSNQPDKFSIDSTGTVTGLVPVTSFPPPYITATDASGNVVQQGYVIVLEDTDTKEEK